MADLGSVSGNIILIADRNGNPVGGMSYANGNGRAMPLTANVARSILSDRLALGKYGSSFAGDRDYFSILGYPYQVETEDYLAKFERDPLAGTIITFPPEETWRNAPEIKDGKDKDATSDSEFVRQWDAFAEKMRAYHYCQRADTLAGIGRFGVLLIGVAGSDDLSTPVERVNTLDDILYLRPYSEDSVEVMEYETDTTSPRFGLPRTYRITLSDLSNFDAGRNGEPPRRGANRSAGAQITVHHSRVIHVAEFLLENEIFGRPRLQRVYNLLDDVLKVVGGSAEATWKLMRKGFVLDVDADAKISADMKTALEEQFDEYDHGLRRFLQTKGMTVSDLGSEVVDPSGPFDAILSLISAATRIPKRILLGSERGELASTQDGANWAGHITSRRQNFAEPVILRPLIDRFIRWGALPRPSSGVYSVMWQPLFELSETEKAAVAQRWAAALSLVAKALGVAPVTVEEFREEFTPFSREMEGMADGLPGPDVLDQTADLLANRGFSEAESRAMILAAARIVARGE